MGAVTRERVFSVEERSEPRQDLLLSPRQMGRGSHMSAPAVRPHLCRLFRPLDVEDRCDSLVRGTCGFERNADRAGILNFDGSTMDDW